MMQLDHYHSPFFKKKHSITLVCDQVSNAPNIGSLFRIADAFGIEQIIFCGAEIKIGRKVTKTSRATEKRVPYICSRDTISIIHKLKKEDYNIICLEIASNSQPLDTFKFNTTHKIALIVGDEKFGISDDVLKLADATIHINMYGQNSSMNVVQATNIILYEITKQINQNTE